MFTKDNEIAASVRTVEPDAADLVGAGEGEASSVW